jgi:biotin transport system substrate-specific component
MKALLRLVAVPAFALLMALCAQVAVPMVPVPMTLQTFAVLLAGAVLGGGRGAVAVLLYLAMATLGLPVLSDGGGGLERFAGPTAGYLLAFPVAALAAGEIVRRPAFRGPFAGVAVMLAAHLFILAAGTLWLAASLGAPAAVAVGFTPFLIGAGVKSVAVVACAALLRRLPAFRS